MPLRFGWSIKTSCLAMPTCERLAMSDSISWFVDLDASLAEAKELAERVSAWLVTLERCDQRMVRRQGRRQHAVGLRQSRTRILEWANQ